MEQTLHHKTNENHLKKFYLMNQAKELLLFYPSVMEPESLVIKLAPSVEPKLIFQRIFFCGPFA